MMKKTIAFLLLAMMLCGMLFSCQAPTADTTDTTPKDTKESSDVQNNTNSDSATKPMYDENGYLNDSLPEKIDSNGQAVSVMGWDKNENLTIPRDAGNGGDPVQEKLYYHWTALENRLGIDMQTTYVNSSWATQDQFFTAARAEDAAYDLIQSQVLFPPVLAQEGKLSNLKKLQYPDLEKPWWPDSVELWTQQGALYFIGSNSSANSLNYLMVVLANQNMISDAGLGDPVKLAVKGSWTVEKLTEYSRAFAGLAVANPGEVFGLSVGTASSLDCLYYASGFTGTHNNANGVAELAFDNEETLTRISDALDLYVTLFQGVEIRINNGDNTPFYQDQTAFFIGNLGLLRTAQDSETYAALPLPKLNNNQQNYALIHNDQTDVWCIPITSVDKELSGMILEANASSEYRVVAPFFFDQYLKKRYSSDVEGIKCFEIIRQSVVYDFGRANTLASIHVDSMWRACFYTYGTGVTVKNVFMTEYTREIGAKRTALTKLLEDYQKYKDQ